MLTLKVNYHQKLLQQFLDYFWYDTECYWPLTDSPKLSTALRLHSEFLELFKISYETQTMEETASWDTFMFLVATTRKLGSSFFEYVHDRISQTMNIPAVATIIYVCGGWR